MAGKTYMKTGLYQWNRIKKIYIKTGGTTWLALKKAYIKTTTGWKKVFDTASNAPYLANGDRPRIRLNSYRSSGYVEAEPVQMMGPSTGYSNGYPLGAIGSRLYGANSNDLANWKQYTGMSYTWLTSVDTNPNNQINVTGQNATGQPTDTWENDSSHISAYDGSFVWFRPTYTNGSLTTSALSNPVYIIKQPPSGSISLSTSSPTTNTQMSATITYSNSWYKSPDTLQSKVDWFLLSSPSQDLSTLTPEKTEYLWSIGSTSYYTPTANNKYVAARLTLNNTYTLPSPGTTGQSGWAGFTPNDPIVYTQVTTYATTGPCGPFTVSGVTKNYPSYDSTLGWQRAVSVNIGQSENATQYEVQIEGLYPYSNGVYGGGSYIPSWIVLQSYQQAPYVFESNRSGGLLTYAKNVADYQFYRVTVRASNNGNTASYSYSNNGTSSTPVYVDATGFAPSTPYISNITTTSDSVGVSISFDVSLISEGSNRIYLWQYSNDGGSSWNTPSGYSYITATSAKFYVNSGTYYSYKIRASNLDGFDSPSSNSLSITSYSKPGDPTNVVVHTYNNGEGTIYFTTSNNTGSVRFYLDYESGMILESQDTYGNFGANQYGKLTISGMSSASRLYIPSLVPYAGSNLTGGTGNILQYSGKYLNSSNKLTVSINTPTSGPDARTINFSWAGGGATNKYMLELMYWYPAYGQYYTVLTTSTTSTSISFTSSDGITYDTQYYLRVTPRYEYATNVYSDGLTVYSSNITSGSNLSVPTITDVQTSDGTNWNVYVSGGGPYYQIYWNSQVYTPSGDYYDAASTSTTISDTYTYAGSVYWYARSSSENFGTSPSAGYATAGKYSAWTPAWLAHQVLYNYNGGSGGTSRATVKDSTYTSLPSASRSGYSFNGWYTASSGGSYVGGSGSSYYVTSSQTLYAQWTQLSVQLSAPTGVSASTNRSDGVLISWSSVANANYYGVWWGGPPSIDTPPDFPNIYSTSYLDTSISTGSSRTYYVQAYSNSSSYTKSNYSSGATGTRISSATAPSTPTNGGGSYSQGTNYVTNATFTSSSSGTTPITYYWSVYSAKSQSGPWSFRNSGSISSSSLSTSLSIPQQSWNQSTYGNWSQYNVYASNSVGSSGTLTWTL